MTRRVKRARQKQRWNRTRSAESRRVVEDNVEIGENPSKVTRKDDACSPKKVLTP